MPKKSKQTALPTFEEESDELPAERFVNLIERQAESGGWDDNKTANEAIEAMKGKAAIWIENLIREKPDETKTWEELKPLFLERWNRIR